MKFGYCIYKNDIVSDLSPEHIIPLALGGCNEFCVDVDRKCNNDLGTAIDGKMANSFLMLQTRQKKGYVGHSRIPAKAKIKNALLGESKEPIQVHLASELTLGEDVSVESVYSAKERRYLSRSETAGMQMESKFTIDTALEMAFTAKTLLAAGFFLYGNDFLQYADHDQLRRHIIWFIAGANPSNDPYKEARNNHRMNLTLALVESQKTGVVPEFGVFGDMANICQVLDESCVIFINTPTQLIGAVGIGGIYIATLVIDANGAALIEKYGLHWCMYVSEGRLNKTRIADLIANHEAWADK